MQVTSYSMVIYSRFPGRFFPFRGFSVDFHVKCASDCGDMGLSVV